MSKFGEKTHVLVGITKPMP